MDKEDVVYIYSGLLLSHEKNETLPFVTWMDLEDVKEVSQKEKDKYSMLSLNLNLKNKKEEYNKKRNRFTDNKLVVTRGEQCGGMTKICEGD